MKNSLVSVIIPTHNGYENIARAVDSALNQTYDNIEIIVVDDNGKVTEQQLRTQEAMDKFQNNPKVKYIVHEKNINGSAARNTGIRVSKGEFIAFLDDDDAFLENNIENHIHRLNTLPDDYAITYCGMELVVPGKPNQIVMPPCEGNVLFDFLCGKIRIGSSLIVVKREAVNYVKEFDESFRRHQDWEFIVRILDKYKVGQVNNIGVFKYNLGRNNAPNPQKFEEYRLHYLNKIKYIIDKFDKRKQNQIYDAHYFTIGKEYLRAKNLKGCFKWTNKTSNPIKYYFGYISSYYEYFKRKRSNRE